MGQGADELFIFVRRLTAEVMVEMCDDQVQLKLCPNFQQQAEKRHGVGPPRNRHHDSISAIKEGVGLNCSNELLKNFGNLHMRLLDRRQCRGTEHRNFFDQGVNANQSLTASKVAAFIALCWVLE
jgi:hypothetical protein